ncbi:MAG: hypothetical protein HC802_08340 [Caldilineaceae bacterium]|nr:hypothetical protein [Caldilineaceae bacterium]
MQIDWFTYFAQLVNFLILVWLLRRYLYRPVLQAMQTRESDLAARFQSAAQQTEQAEQERARFLAQQDELERARERLVAEAEAEAEARRKRMIGEAREEVEEMQGRWYAAVEHEKELFLLELRRRLGESAMYLTRRALSDLADEALEARIIDSFIRRLNAVDPETRGLAPSQGQTSLVLIRTSFELAYQQRQQIVEALQQFFVSAGEMEEISVRFEREADLICGVELQVGARRLAWSLRDYLETIAAQLDHLFDAEEVESQGEPDPGTISPSPQPELSLANQP